MRGRLAVSVVALVLTVVALVPGASAAVHGELSTSETILGAVVVTLAAAVCVIGIQTRVGILRHQRDERKAEVGRRRVGEHLGSTARIRRERP